MSNLTDHQYAQDGRIAFGFGGSGEGHVIAKSEWGTANLTVNSEHRVFKCLKDCYVSNFSLKATAMDSHATPLLTIDVGTQDDDDEFISGATVGQAGGVELTNVVDESTEAGFPLVAGDYIIVSVKAAAATPVAGTTFLRFDVSTSEL
jgi:hypothetical protein